MGGRVGGGGWPACSQREGKRVSTELTEGQVKEHRAGVWSELEYAVAHSRQTPKIESLYFFSPPIAVREKPQTSQRKIHYQTEHREKQRELSSDEPRRVFEKAALLLEGFMAMEYRLSFQEGTTEELAAGQLDGLNFLSPLIYIPLSWNCLSVSFSGFNQPPIIPCPDLPPSLSPSKLYSQMLNLTGLLVKSASTDGFHLGTGLLDPHSRSNLPLLLLLFLFFTRYFASFCFSQHAF